MTRPIFAAFCAILACFVTLDAVSAQLKGLPFRKKQNQGYSIELNQRHGPWLIMCASFVDEDGLQQAKALVQELRETYRLNAYIYAQHFDFSSTVIGNGWENFTTVSGDVKTRQPRMKAYRNQPFDEYAVLVGDFPSLEDSRAQKTLEQIKYIKPGSLTVSETVETNQRMGMWREIQRRISPNPTVKEKGPMRAAFIMPNPTLPEEYFVQQGLDPFVAKMNKNVKHSLLKCPHPFSVKVATFRGETTFRNNEMEVAKRDFEQRKRFNQPVTESRLAEAAAKAHLLTKELRKSGIEAYEFHDRNESFVCVGSFPWATRKLSNGKDELNPDVAAVIKKFKARMDSVAGVQGGVRRKSIPSLAGHGIFFDIQPLPVNVPQLHRTGLLSRR